MGNWRKIGEVQFNNTTYMLFLNARNTSFAHGRTEQDSIGGWKITIHEMESTLNGEFYALVKPIVDMEIEKANDPSISPNARSK